MCEEGKGGDCELKPSGQSMLNFVKCLVYQVGKVQLGFCSLSIDEGVRGGGRRRIWPMGGGGFEANQAIQGTFFPRSSSARRGSRSHGDLLQQRIQIFMTLSGGLREMPFALFSSVVVISEENHKLPFSGNHINSNTNNWGTSAT